MRRQVPDPVLRERLQPQFTIGCKRILFSDDWYPALQQPNVELVTDGIAEVRENSIVTADGTEREIDTIIYGTGFHVTDTPLAGLVRGRDGRTLAEAWEGSPKAFNGTAIPGFPNFFMMLGPNTGLGHTSVIYMIESQVAYVVGALKHMARRRAAALEVRQAALDEYVREIDSGLGGDGLERRRMPQLVPGSHGPQRGDLARADVPLPRAAARVRPRAVRDRRLDAGPRAGGRLTRLRRLSAGCQAATARSPTMSHPPDRQISTEDERLQPSPGDSARRCAAAKPLRRSVNCAAARR